MSPSDFFALLEDKNYLMILMLIGLGYLLQYVPWLNNRHIPLILLVTGLALGSLETTVVPGANNSEAYLLGAQKGIIYAALAVLLHGSVLKYVDDWVRSKFGNGFGVEDLPVASGPRPKDDMLHIPSSPPLSSLNPSQEPKT